MLRLALSDLGRGHEWVAAFPDILQYAPLFSDFNHREVGEYATRCAKMGVVRSEDSSQLTNAILKFLQIDFSAYDEVVLWRGEGAGDRLFGYMVCALVGRDLSVVDLALLRDVLPNPDIAALSMGHCSVKNLKLLLGGVKPLAESEKTANAELWHKWSKSVADLRLLANDGEIVEADRQIFDDVILSASSGEWQPAARVVGRVLCQIDFAVGDSFLHRRIVELASESRILVRQREGVILASNTLSQSLFVGDVDFSELRLFEVKAN